MKIGILTRHAVANYGSLFQTYATQLIFKKLGYDSEVINYTRKDEDGLNIAKTMLNSNESWNRNAIKKILYLLLQTPNYYFPYKRFIKFRKQLLKETSNKYSSTDELKSVVDNYSILCSGSDQIWGKIGNDDYDDNYFLAFCNDKRVKKISLASSFGKNNIEKNLNLYTKLLNDYDFVSIREKTASDFINKSGIKTFNFLDPTLLIDKSIWYNMANNSIKYKDYILIYQLHENILLEKYATDLSKITGKKIIRISLSRYYSSKNGKLIYMPNPNEFLSYFKNASIILSDSFHATVFSIIFEKNFIDFLPGKTGVRIKDFLNLIGLSDRIVEENDFSILQKKIDYLKVNSNIDKIKKDNLEVLKTVLDGEYNG